MAPLHVDQNERLRERAQARFEVNELKQQLRDAHNHIWFLRSMLVAALTYLLIVVSN